MTFIVDQKTHDKGRIELLVLSASLGLHCLVVMSCLARVQLHNPANRQLDKDAVDTT